jgi:hypothetical protein
MSSTEPVTGTLASFTILMNRDDGLCEVNLDGYDGAEILLITAGGLSWNGQPIKYPELVAWLTLTQQPVQVTLAPWSHKHGASLAAQFRTTEESKP